MARFLSSLRRPADDGLFPALTAAAVNIPLDDRNELKKALGRRQNWQPQAYDAFDVCGEVKFAINYLSDACSKLRLYAATRPSPDADPIPSENPISQLLVEQLSNPWMGWGDITGPLSANLSIAGEGYLVGLAEGQGAEPEWSAHSIDEVVMNAQGKLALREDPADRIGRVLVEGQDYITRIYKRHPRYARLADSSLRGVLSSVEELVLFEQMTRSSARSRLPAGILKVPSEIDSRGTADPTQNTSGGQAKKTDPFLDDLFKTMTEPIRNPADASAQVPMVVKAKAEYLKSMEHMTLDRPLDAELDTRTVRALKRLAQGLNVPVEVVLGMEDVNHWTAWQIEEAAAKAHIAPLAALLVAGLTYGYFKPFGAPEGDFIWFDMSPIIMHPNRVEETKDAFDRFAINYETYRDSIGYGEEHGPSEDEINQRLQIEQAKNTRPREQVEPGKEPSGPENPVPAEPDAPDSGASTPSKSIVAAGAAERRRIERIGFKLHSTDRTLKAMLYSAADQAIKTAMSKVGASIRNKAARNKAVQNAIQTVGNENVAATLGPSMVGQLGVKEREIVEGVVDGLEDQFAEWTRAAHSRALDLVPNLAAHERAEHAAVFERDRAEAWGGLKDSLMSEADRRLFNPTTAAVRGEQEPSMRVPFGVVREYVARAGGAHGAAAPIEAAGRSPAARVALGLATGWGMKKLFATKGVGIEGYAWDYGDFPRTSEFEPHADLDGVEFTNFDDDVLENPEGWPDSLCIPGDHDGCMCDVIPITRAIGGAA